jgi:hypothetical protein
MNPTSFFDFMKKLTPPENITGEFEKSLKENIVLTQ